MATVNLGLIKFRWQGAYAGGTAYVKDDVVSYNGSSYVCILASTGNLPTNTTYWNVMSQKGTDGTDITSISGLAQGDILYYNGTAWVKLGAGVSGQVLQTGGTGANPSWTDQAGGATELISHTTFNSTGTTSGLITTTDWSTNGYFKISVVGQCNWGNRNDQGGSFRYRDSSGDITTTNHRRVGFASYGTEDHSTRDLTQNIDLNGLDNLQINGWGQNNSYAMGVFTIEVFKPDLNNRQVTYSKYYNNDTSASPYHAYYSNMFANNDTGTKTGFKVYNSNGYNFTNGFVTVVGHKYS